MNSLKLLKELCFDNDSDAEYTVRVETDFNNEYFVKYLFEESVLQKSEDDAYKKAKILLSELLNNLDKVTILSCKEFDKEVIGFECKLIYNGNVIAMEVYDDLSPNRYYNLPHEYDRDKTAYQIAIKMLFIGKKKQSSS